MEWIHYGNCIKNEEMQHCVYLLPVIADEEDEYLGPLEDVSDIQICSSALFKVLGKGYDFWK